MDVTEIRLAVTLAYHCAVCCVGAAFIASTTVPAQARKQTQKQALQNRISQSPLPNHEVQAARALLMTASIDYFPDGKVKTITVTGKAKVSLKKVADIQETEEEDANERRDGDARYTIHLETSAFSDAEYSRLVSNQERRYAGLVVKIGDKVFVPYSYGGSQEGVNTVVDLRNVDKASAEALCGYKLSPAPKNSLLVAFKPRSEAYSMKYVMGEKGGATIQVDVTNVGKTPLTFYWGTTAGQNPPARDTQLFFTATRNGTDGSENEKVAANPKPLGDGYLRSPIQLAPQSTLHHSANLTQWLAFDKPGTYQVAANYKVFIQNPKAGAFPSQWTVIYHGTFPLQIERNR